MVQTVLDAHVTQIIFNFIFMKKFFTYRFFFLISPGIYGQEVEKTKKTKLLLERVCQIDNSNKSMAS